MKKVIIGIHGLGNKPPKYLLCEWWKEAMLEGLEHQNIAKKLPKFELAYWADILHDKPLDFSERNTKSPYYIDEPYTKASENFLHEDHPYRTRVVDFISNQLNSIFLNEDKSLNYSFITDYILREYFSDLEAYYREDGNEESDNRYNVKDLIRKRIAEIFEKYRKYDIMIVAHSMGSIIGLDVLNFHVPDIKVNTLVTIGSPLGLPIVVSKLVAEQKTRHKGKNIIATPAGVTKKWYNLADITDKVALNYKLADDFQANEEGIGPEDFLVNNNYEVNDILNPHKSYGYLRTPRFSIILSDFIGEEKGNLLQKLSGKLMRVFRIE